MKDLVYVYPNVFSSGVDEDGSGDGYTLEKVVCNSACSLLYVSGLIPSGQDAKYLQVFDSDTAPVDGDYPILSIPIDSTATINGYMEWRASLNGIRLQNGLALGSSSTAARYTSDSGSGIFMVAMWIK